MCLDKHDSNPQNKHEAKYQRNKQAQTIQHTRNKELSNRIQGTNTQQKTQQQTEKRQNRHRKNNTDRTNTNRTATQNKHNTQSEQSNPKPHNSRAQCNIDHKCNETKWLEQDKTLHFG
jgi:hypothetical protein